MFGYEARLVLAVLAATASFFSSRAGLSAKAKKGSPFHTAELASMLKPINGALRGQWPPIHLS